MIPDDDDSRNHDERTVDAIVAAAVRDVLAGQGLRCPRLDRRSDLATIGMDPLDLAIVAHRLEAEIGFNPFENGEVDRLPRTLGELIDLYDVDDDREATWVCIHETLTLN